MFVSQIGRNEPQTNKKNTVHLSYMMMKAKIESLETLNFFFFPRLILKKFFVFCSLAPFDRIVDQDLRLQYFKFPSNIYHLHVQKAFLWLYMKGSSSSSSQLKTNSWIVIYQVVRNGHTPLVLVRFCFSFISFHISNFIN